MKFSELSKETVLQAIFRSSILNVLSRVWGYLKQVVIAVLLGFNLETDAFFLAFSILGLFIIFTEVFDTLGVPNLVKARLESLEKFQNLTGTLLVFTTIVAVTVTSFAIVLSPIVVNIALGYNELEKHILKEYFLLLTPYLFFNFFFHHFGAIQRSLRHFTIFFFGEFIFSFFSFLFIFLGLMLTKNPKILPISISLAQLIATFYIFLVSKPYWGMKVYIDKDVKRMLKQFIQLLSVYSVLHIYMLVDRVFASYLPHKSISALAYGWMVAMIPKGIFKIEHIIITPLAEVNAAWDKVKFYLTKIFIFGIFVAIFIFIFAPYIVDILFGYGAFTEVDSNLTAIAVKFYSLSIPFVFLWNVLYRIFQIKEKINFIIPIITITAILNILFNYLFIFKLHLNLIGICLATFFSYASLNIFSFLLLNKLK